MSFEKQNDAEQYDCFIDAEAELCYTVAVVKRTRAVHPAFITKEGVML